MSDVKASDDVLETVDRKAALSSLLGGRVEQLGEGRPLVRCTDTNAFGEAALTAFYGHHPLVISPDAVWFCLAQGFATHVSLNAEALRKQFVAHDGKKKLLVERRDFFLGQPNPWPEAFEAFSQQVAQHVGKLHGLVAGAFSTTGPVERAAFDVLVMDTFQPYFEYEMMCGCGIPRVLLTGTVEDWRSVRRRAAMLSEFGLEWWTDSLLPVLDQLVLSAEGRADRSFWRSFFRYESGSGPAELTGWIQVLFPYLTDGKKPLKNTWLAQWGMGIEKAERRKSIMGGPLYGPGIGQLPSSIASSPVKFIDVRDGSVTMLRFVAGMFGVASEDGALRPEFGWAVVHDAGTVAAGTSQRKFVTLDGE